jgi:hypothetical protein
MSRVRSALGEVIDFDMLAIKNSFGKQKPKVRPIPQLDNTIGDSDIVSSMTTEEIMVDIQPGTKEYLMAAVQANKAAEIDEAAELVITEPTTTSKKGK